MFILSVTTTESRLLRRSWLNESLAGEGAGFSWATEKTFLIKADDVGYTTFSN